MAEPTVNENFTRQFFSTAAAATKPHPFLLAADKAENAIRIFILGESAAQGTPNPAFGFARILEVMLRSQYPQKRFEVINAAVRGINSHIVLPIARECAGHDPDLFVVYTGNNEVVGLHAPGPDSGFLHRNRTVIRAVQSVRSLKTGQWLANLIEGHGPPREQNMDFFRAHRIALDDPCRRRVYENFAANLDALCAATTRSGAKVLLSTVPVNLKDFPPIASWHRSDLTASNQVQWESAYALGKAAETAGHWQDAVRNYLAAERLDDHFAELHYRMARCYFAAGGFENSAKRFVLARDWDALPFRADTPVNATIRDVAAAMRTRGGVV